MDDFDPIDLIDSGIEFDPSSWQDWGLIIMMFALAIGGYFYVDWELKQGKDKPTHRYNRETGEVVPNEE